MQDSIRLRFEVLEKLVPFFLHWDTEGILTLISRPLAAIWGDDNLDNLQKTLMLTRPFKSSFKPAWLNELTDVTVQLTHKDKSDCVLKGQIIEKENGWMFVGFPLLYSLSELEAFGLQLSDLPTHDGFGDLLIATEASRASLVESQNTAKELVEANKALMSVNESFSRFVPQDFLDELGHETAGTVGLGDHVGTSKCVMFADLRGFTSISEQLGAERIFSLINRYLSAVAPCIREEGGYVCQYLGDGIMALFPGDSDSSVLAAVAMQGAMRDLNASLDSLQHELKIGIGIHFGHLALGIVGETFRWGSTIISDAVNTASRVEGLTKLFGAEILLTDSVVNCLKSPERFNIRRLGSARLKGRDQTVQLYEVLDALDADSLESKTATKALFEEALVLFEREEHEAALHAFDEVLRLSPDDGAARHYQAILLTRRPPMK